MVSFLQVPIARPSYASRRLRRTLSAWVSEVSGLSDSGTQGADTRVMWAEQNLPRGGLPIITMRELRSTSQPSQTRIMSDVPETLEIVIDPGAVSAGVIVNFGDYRAVGGDLVSGLSDALVSGPDKFAATITGADRFDLTGPLVWPYRAINGVTVNPINLRPVEILETTRTSIVRIEIAGANTPDERALDYGDALIADLGRSAASSAFAYRGVSIVGNRPTLTDISALSGGERESRAFFDLQVAQWTRHATAEPATLAGRRRAFD